MTDITHLTGLSQTVQPIRREIVVDVAPDRAFEIFTAEMTSWWRPEHHIGTAPIRQIVIEPRAGGRWMTHHEDDNDTFTGFVTVWEPPHRLVLTWQLGADWKYHDDLVTTVEVRFAAEGADRTRVTLEHRDLDAFGADAAEMHQTFDDPDAWEGTLTAYAAVANRLGKD